MKSELMFFDNSENSAIGFYRGLVTIFPIALSIYFLFRHVSIDLKNIVSIFTIALLICSALGVHMPATPEIAITYSFLVGLVVYGSIASVLFSTGQLSFENVLVLCAGGILSTSVSGYILFILTRSYPDNLKLNTV